jgi:hypothetical protein
METKRYLLSAVLSVAALCGCRSAFQNSEDCSVIARKYFQVGADQVMREFTNHDLETQYSIYLCATQYMHPPLLEFANRFASEGQGAADFLKAKLRKASDDRDIQDIARVFAEMKRQGTYDATADKELMVMLRKKVGAMKDPFWQGQAKIVLGRIEAPTQ